MKPPRESGLPPRDSGLPPRKTNLPPRDSGLPPRDSGLSPRDSGLPPRDPDPLGKAREAVVNGKIRLAETGRIEKVMDHALKFLERLAKRRGRRSTYVCTVTDRTSLSDFDEDQLGARNERTVIETGEEFGIKVRRKDYLCDVAERIAARK